MIRFRRISGNDFDQQQFHPQPGGRDGPARRRVDRATAEEG